MKVSRRGLIGLSLAIGLCLAGCPTPEETYICLWGRVDLDGPVDASAVAVQEADSLDLLAELTTFDGDFLDFVLEKEFGGVGNDLLLTASGGSVAGKAFDGMLMAYVPAYMASDHIEINILTTLIAEYINTWAEPYEQARQDVFDYLGLPRDYDLLDTAHQECSQQYFDSASFMEEAKANGGFNPYVTYLVENEIGWDDEEGGEYKALRTWEKSQVVPGLGDMAAKVGKWVGGKILDSAGSWAADQALGWVLSLFGYQNSTDTRFDAIDRKLELMDGKLDVIQSEVMKISGQLDELLANVNLSRDQIIQQISGYDISAPQRVIANQYENLMLQFNHGGADAHSTNGYNRALQLSNEILSPSAYDIDQQLANLHSGIMGGTVGMVGFLDACTNVLLDRLAAGEDLLDAYRVLEESFSELAAVQQTGLLLMAEALHFKNNDIEGTSKSFSGTVADFHAKFARHMEAQVEKFLVCVDRLVVSQFDVTTDLANPVEVLPESVKTVYTRADLCAHYLSGKHPAGFVLRLVGTPKDVHDMMSAGVSVTDRVVNISCYDGWKAGGDCGGTMTETVTVTPFEAVPVNGKTVNFYLAPLPAHYSSAGYFEWSSDAGGKNFYHLQKSIAVAKLRMGQPLPPAVRSECYPCASAGGMSGHDRAWALVPNLQGFVAGGVEDALAVYPNELDPTDQGAAYANWFFPLRHQPGVWQSTHQWNQSPGNNQLVHTFDAGSMKMAAHVWVRDFRSRPYHGPTYGFSSSLFESMLLAPSSATDACKVSATTRSQIVLGYSHNKHDLIKGTLGEQASLGATAGVASAAARDPHGIPDDPGERRLTPVDTGDKTVTGTLPNGSDSTLRFGHGFTGDGWVEKRTQGNKVEFFGEIQYSKIELYPAR